MTTGKTYPSFGLMLLGFTGGIVSLLAALALAVGALVSISAGQRADALVWVVAAGSFTGLALLAIPAVWIGGRTDGLRSLPGISRIGWRSAYLLMPIFLVAAAAGQLAFQRDILPYLLGPPAHIVASAFPVLAAVMLLRRLGRRVPSSASLGAFLVGTWLVPPLALVLELALLAPIIAVAAIGLMMSGEGQELIRQLQEQLPLFTQEFSFEPDPQLLLRPWIVLPAAGFIAGIVPVVEEVLKTMALWRRVRERPTAALGFYLGGLTGAGYALFEALFLTSPGEQWLPTMIGRAGASLMHVFSAAIAGWGLGSALSTRRIWPAVRNLGAAVLLHGLWNLTVVAVGFITLAAETSPTPWTGRLLSPTEILAVALLTGLTMLSALGLAFLPQRLARQIESQLPDDFEESRVTLE